MARTDGRRIEQWIDDLAAMRAGARGSEVPTPRRRPDADIAADIRRAFGDDQELQANPIDVSVTGGIVTLEGDVGTRFGKHWAARVVDRCPGVVDVRNRLRVREDGPANLTA